MFNVWLLNVLFYDERLTCRAYDTDKPTRPPVMVLLDRTANRPLNNITLLPRNSKQTLNHLNISEILEYNETLLWANYLNISEILEYNETILWANYLNISEILEYNETLLWANYLNISEIHVLEYNETLLWANYLNISEILEYNETLL